MKITNSTQASDRWVEYTGKILWVASLKLVELFRAGGWGWGGCGCVGREPHYVGETHIAKEVISIKQMFVGDLFNFCSIKKKSHCQ